MFDFFKGFREYLWGSPYSATTLAEDGPVSKLPAEMWQSIATHMTTLKDLGQFNQVCRQFRAVTDVESFPNIAQIKSIDDALRKLENSAYHQNHFGQLVGNEIAFVPITDISDIGYKHERSDTPLGDYSFRLHHQLCVQNYDGKFIDFSIVWLSLTEENENLSQRDKRSLAVCVDKLNAYYKKIYPHVFHVQIQK
jgi:hypothetical protein